VPEEDPHYLLDYDEEEDPKMDLEEEEPEEEPVVEPKPLAGHGDQFDAHPNSQPGNMNGWVDDDDDDDDVEEEEDKENEDADMDEDDDAEIIFPYEEQGDQTPPPRDESSDSDDEPEAEDADDEHEAEDANDELEVEDADVELETEESDGVPEAAIGTGGLAPWPFRRDLEALRGHERIREAESETKAHMREIIRDQFATSMNEFMASMNSGAGGSGGASGSGGAVGSGGTGGNADGTGVRAMGIEAANNTPWSE
nr:hypothetical protein [Tanacetum cinerariifolium]